MEQNTADGGKKKADELEERDGGFHERTFRGEGMGIVYVGEQNGMLEGRIDYQEFDEENFQYVISPYWEIVDSMAAISDTAVGFSDGIFAAVTGGIDIVDRSGRVLIEATSRHSLVPVVIAQHLIAYEERFRKRQEGSSGQRPKWTSVLALKWSNLTTLEAIIKKKKNPWAGRNDWQELTDFDVLQTKPI